MKRYLRLISVVCLVVLVFGAGFMAGAGHESAFAQSPTNQQPANTQALFSPFWQAWNIVHSQYVDKIDDNALMEGALGGMVAALGDAHSEYLNVTDFNLFNSSISGTFDGIGATVRKDTTTGGMLIVSPIANSPARAAGLKAGDLIVMVDGEDITALSQSQIIDKIRGPVGTKVRIGIVRPGSRSVVQLTITRAHLEIPEVVTAVYAGNIGYVRLADFSSTGQTALARALRTIKADTRSGLILDLRDNPGGGLQTALNVASQFIKSGPLVIERGKPGTQDIVYESDGRSLAPDVPMVVLVNESSASASELVAGALHDRGRAIIIGTRSYGKGSVQVLSKLTNGGGVAITIAHFYTPTDRIIDKIGINPDIVVPWNLDAFPDYDVQLSEAVRYLRNEF